MITNSKSAAPDPSTGGLRLAVSRPETAFTRALRPYTRTASSPSLARTQRILELNQRIAARFRALPDADAQQEKNFAIAKRAKFVREIHELEVRVMRADSYSAGLELKKQLQIIREKLDLFDRWQMQMERAGDHPPEPGYYSHEDLAAAFDQWEI